MTTDANSAGWTTAAVLVGRLIFAAVFINQGTGGGLLAVAGEVDGGSDRMAQARPV